MANLALNTLSIITTAVLDEEAIYADLRNFPDVPRGQQLLVFWAADQLSYLLDCGFDVREKDALVSIASGVFKKDIAIIDDTIIKTAIWRSIYIHAMRTMGFPIDEVEDEPSTEEIYQSGIELAVMKFGETSRSLIGNHAENIVFIARKANDTSLGKNLPMDLRIALVTSLIDTTMTMVMSRCDESNN